VLKKLGESMGDIFDMNAMLGGAGEAEGEAAEGGEEEEEEANLHTAASDGELLYGCPVCSVVCCGRIADRDSCGQDVVWLLVQQPVVLSNALLQGQGQLQSAVSQQGTLPGLYFFAFSAPVAHSSSRRNYHSVYDCGIALTACLLSCAPCRWASLLLQAMPSC
jgi:hypothetical protein